MLAGGPEILREDARWLAQNASSDTHPWEEWPESIQKLGYRVDIQAEKHLIEVGLGNRCGMCAYLGFIIQTGDTTIPLPSDIEEFGDPYPLVDGIYFVVQ